MFQLVKQNTMSPQPKKFKLLNPEQWGLDPSKTFIAVQTDKGYAIRITNTEWIGLPKSLVERLPAIYQPIKGGYTKSK